MRSYRNFCAHYGAAHFGGLALRGGLSYTWNDVSVDRTVAATASQNAFTAQFAVKF